MQKLLDIYAILFARLIFIKFNKMLYRLSLAGLGILNYKTPKISGEKAFIEKLLSNKTGVVIDVGANCGDYCREILRVNKNIKIYAFEPHPLTFINLSKNTKNFKNIFALNKGVSSTNGFLKLYDYKDNDGSEHASLFKEVISEIHGSNSVISHEVETITLDDFIKNQSIEEVVLLKIDTEGNELEVVRGCVQSIQQRKIKAIHFEFNEMNVASRVFLKDFWKILNEYTFYRLLPNEMMKINIYNPIYCEIFAYQNIVAILNTD